MRGERTFMSMHTMASIHGAFDVYSTSSETVNAGVQCKLKVSHIMFLLWLYARGNLAIKGKYAFCTHVISV